MIVAPMLLESSGHPHDARDYIYEPKLEGLRVMLSRTGSETRLLYRDTEVTRQYPDLHAVPIDGDLILDGVICCKDQLTGWYDKRLVMERLRLSKRKQIHAAAVHRPVTFIAFDIIGHKDRDLRTLSLMKRKSILDSVLSETDHFRIIPYTEDTDELLCGNIGNRESSGLIAKRKDSKYVGRRSHDWVHLISKDLKAKSILPVYVKNEEEAFDPSA